MSNNISKLSILVILFLSLLIQTNNAGPVMVGISPDYLDLGEIKPGESKIARFYAVTSSDEMFIVGLGSVRGNMFLFERKEKYKDLLEFHSEEDVSSWVSFINNPLKLLPPNETLESTKAGGMIKGMREIVFILKVPEDAEPGYHTGFITVNPSLPPGVEAPFSVKSLIPLKYIFKVQGNATRDGEILDITNNGIRRDELWLKIFYRNTGNVTTSIDESKIDIFSNGELIGTVKTSSAYVKPGEIKELDGFINYDYFEEVSYPVKATVSYITEKAVKEGEITIIKPSEVITGKVTQEEKKGSPWLIVLVVIIFVILYILFKR